MFIYPATAVPDGGSGNPDTSLLCLIDIHAMVMSGVAAQHVQPLSSKPFFRMRIVRAAGLLAWFQEPAGERPAGLATISAQAPRGPRKAIFTFWGGYMGL